MVVGWLECVEGEGGGGKGRVDTRNDLVCCVSLKRIIILTCFGLIRHLYPYHRGEKGYTLIITQRKSDTRS